MENGRTLKSTVVSTLILLVNVYKFDQRLLKWKDDFEKLMLSEFDIRRLYSIFRQIDVDGSGTIDVLELLMFFDIESTKFSRQVFSVMDEDTSGEIDFREFVISCWNYATLGDEALVLFGFDLYDRDCSNCLEAAEIAKMLHDLYGKNFEKNKRAMKLHHDIEHGQHQTFTPADFREFAKNHPALFFPAFEMQRLIQTKVLGKMFWQRHAEKRLLASSDGVVRVKDLIGFRTKVNEPSSHLRELHPIFQNHGLPATHHYTVAGMEGKSSAPPTPTRRDHMYSATSSTSNVVAEFDEPVKQFMHNQAHLESVLELTDTRGHRAAKMKQARDSKPPEKLTPIQREQMRKEKVDNIIQRCSDPPVELSANWVHSQDRIQTRVLPTWRSENHLGNETHKQKEKEVPNHEKHTHEHHHHHRHEKSSEELPAPKTDNWSSLLQLQSIVITKPKKEKKRRSTFSFFGNSPTRIAPIDTKLLDQHAHPIADAVINGQVGGEISTPIKKKDKKRRYSV